MMKMKSSPPMCPTNPSSLTHALHHVVEDLRENPDDPIALVVRVSVVELLEVIEIGVAGREQRVERQPPSDLRFDLHRAGEARRRMHVQIAIRPTQHRIEPDGHLRRISGVADHLVGARPKARVEGQRDRSSR